MFKVTGSASRDCEGLVRRSFVQAGVLGLGGLTLAEFLKLKSSAADDSSTAVPHRSDTSVILIWMSGGPGHHETWDPKPQAVSEYRGPFGAISTTAPGVQFSEMLSEQAKIAEHLSVIRTASHGTGDHTKGNHWMLTFDRLSDRRLLLNAVDGVRRTADRQMTDMSDHQRAAFGLLTSKAVRAAFDISAESDATRDKYGRHTFGQSALLARRLVERGVTFVTVNTQPWDHHGTANRLPTEKGAKQLIPPTDRAIAGLIRDLIDRDLYRKTLVVAMGEVGRTPKMNSAAGRDHWGHSFSVMMAGGETTGGIVVGESDKHGAYVKDRPVHPEDVAATVYHHLGIDGRRTTLKDRTGRPMHLVERGEVIRELYA